MTNSLKEFALDREQLKLKMKVILLNSSQTLWKINEEVKKTGKYKEAMEAVLTEAQWLSYKADNLESE